MKIKVRLNWGRWIAECPKGDGGVMEVKPDVDSTFICPECYPKSIAMFAGIINKRFVKSPDISARRTARLMAEAAGDVYDVEYPEDMAEILQILSTRNKENQNWEPGESVAFLIAENSKHGI